MPADFNYYINRQGARGRQGLQGAPGFSPVVTVNTNTAEAYILNIETADGVLTTPNLKSTPLNFIEGAGNYVMYDPSTQQIYNSDVPDELVLRTDLATTENPGIIQIADAEDIAENATDVAVTPKQLNDAMAEVEGEIPNDYVDLTSNQNVGGTKTFSSQQQFSGGLSSGSNVIITGGNSLNFNKSSDYIPNIYLKKESRTLHLKISNGVTETRLLNATDVDNNTVWINDSGQLSARGEDFPDNIDGGVFHASPLGEYTFSVENIDTASITPVVAVAGQRVSTGTITLYDRAAVKCDIVLYINDDYTIDRSGYSYQVYNQDTGRWESMEVGGMNGFLTEETTTATAAGCTFSIDWDLHVITIVGQ